MNPRALLHESRFQVPISWEIVRGREISEADFVLAISQLPLGQLLPALITLLQYGDASEPATYGELDRRICQLFPSDPALRITDRLSQGSPWMFFSKLQLLYAIKLLCAFGSREPGKARVSNDQLLNLLLMTNGFYSRMESRLDTAEGVEEGLQRLTLLGYSVIQRERPANLIGRYSELFGRLAASASEGTFKSWVDIQKEFAARFGVQLDVFKAVLFVLYGLSTKGSSWPDDGSARPQPGCVIPEQYFADMRLTKGELNCVLDLVATDPDQIRDEHHSAYGDGIGNPVDLGILLRKPVMKLTDGSLAGISGQLLIQRYTCGLYWDIHDCLPDDVNAKPNRRLFQTFFGELHERYGRDILQRIKDAQASEKKTVRLLTEEDYAPGIGSNPDSLVIETIGSCNTRCMLFEFKVGRPRYMESIVGGDVQSFQEDVRRKIEEGLDQEIGFYRLLQASQREIPGLKASNITAWFFIIVVTDPFPAMGILLEPLREKLAGSPALGKSKRYGPFILSLAELEQLETLPKSRVSQLLIDWDTGPDRNWPFNTFYAHRTKNQPIGNSHLSELAEDDMNRVPKTLFGSSVPPC